MAKKSSRRVMVAALAFTAALAGGGILALRGESLPPTPADRSNSPAPPPALAGPPRVATGEVDSLGRAVTISCASCHANWTPNHAVSSGEQLVEFHQGLHFRHGALSCLSCHNPDNYNLLRLADGRAVEHAQVQTLCSQCHAPQARDYERGVHGGMTGYWDTSRGSRRRKGCVDCHDPHAPAFPAMAPTFKPHDRFLDPKTPESHHD